MKNRKVICVLLAALTASVVVISSGCSDSSTKSETSLTPVIAESSAFESSENTGDTMVLDRSTDFKYEVSEDDNDKYIVIKGIADTVIPQSNQQVEIRIPETIDKLSVKKIDDGAFWELSLSGVLLTKVTMPDTIEIIGDSAFRDLKALHTVEFSENLKTIQMTAFYGCISLDNVILPDNVEKIGSFAFGACSALNTIHIPQNLMSLGEDVFASTPIADYTTEGPVYIDNILYAYNFGADIKSSMEKLSKTGFEIKEGTRIIASNALSGYPRVVENNSMDDALEQSKQADAKNFAAVDIKIPDSVVILSTNSFHNVHVGNINFSQEVMKTSHGVFLDCIVDNVEIDKHAVNLKGDDMQSPFYGINTSRITIPSSIKTVDRYLFGGSEIETIILEDGIQKIEAPMISFDQNMEGQSTGYKTLKSVYIPASVTEIQEENFRNLFGVLYYETDGKITLGNITNPPNVTIYTQSGSTAEEYAKKFNIKCQIVNGADEVP